MGTASIDSDYLTSCFFFVGLVNDILSIRGRASDFPLLNGPNWLPEALPARPSGARGL